MVWRIRIAPSAARSSSRITTRATPAVRLQFPARDRRSRRSVMSLGEVECLVVFLARAMLPCFGKRFLTGLALQVRTTSEYDRAIQVDLAPSDRARVNISEYALYFSAVGTGRPPSGPRECHTQVRSMSDALRKLACFLLFFTIGVGSVDSLAQSRATDQNYYAPVDP